MARSRARTRRPRRRRHTAQRAAMARRRHAGRRFRRATASRSRACARSAPHPALFVYDPRPSGARCASAWDVIDIHEEPFALATAEVLLLRALRRRARRTPVVLYTAQNLRKRYPIPFRWLERWALREASGISACNADAARIAEDKGFAGRARVIPLGVDDQRFRPSDVPGAESPAVRRTRATAAGREARQRRIETRPRRSPSASSGAWCPRRACSCCWMPSRATRGCGCASPARARLQASSRDLARSPRHRRPRRVRRRRRSRRRRRRSTARSTCSPCRRCRPRVDRAVRPRRRRGDGVRRTGRLERRRSAARRRRRRGHRRPAGDVPRPRRRAGRGRRRPGRRTPRERARARRGVHVGCRRPRLPRAVPIGRARGIRPPPPEPRGHRRRLRRARAAAASARARRRACRSRSSTTPRCPRSRRSAPSSACATSIPGATAGSRPASTSALARPAASRRRRAAAESRRGRSRPTRSRCCTARCAPLPISRASARSRSTSSGRAARVEWPFPSPRAHLARGPRASAACSAAPVS